MSPEAPQPDAPATTDVEEAPAAVAPVRRGRPMFNKRPVKVPLAAEAAARQGQAAALAWAELGGDAARAFLNTHDDALGGRPIDLAVAGDAGLAAVEAAIVARAARRDEA